MNAARRSCASRYKEWKWVMEIIGDDKKIRALFSEAKLADAQATPGFTSLLNRAQSRALRPRRAFKLSFAAGTGLAVRRPVSRGGWWAYSPPTPTDPHIA